MAVCNVSFEFLPMVCRTNGVSDQWSVTTFARVHSNARTVHPLCTVRALLCTLANVSVSTLRFCPPVSHITRYITLQLHSVTRFGTGFASGGPALQKLGQQ